MYRLSKLYFIGSAILLSAFHSYAATVVIEGFEGVTATADPGNWQATSPTPQTHNMANSAATATPTNSTEHVTEGAQSGEFKGTFRRLDGSGNDLGSFGDATSNPHVAGGPLRFCSMRYNCNAPGSLNGNSVSTANGVIEADLYNNNPFPMSVSIVCDTTALGQLERGPFIEVPANSSGTYLWNLATTPPVGWVTGNGSFDGAANCRVKTIVVYSAQVPDASYGAINSFFIDNIRNTNAQTDVTAPAIPVPYSAKQGGVAGQLTFNWKANTDGDLAGYRVYMTTDATFTSPTINRLTFPGTPAGSTAAGVNTITLSGVPTNENVYVQVRAFDTATPVANESEGGIVLGVRLKPDGSAVQDHVILDYDRQQPGQSNFLIEGYGHGICYNGRAIHAINRYYDSANAVAVDAGLNPLVASATGITIWSNLLDGGSATSIALSDQSVAALTTFLGANGNLLISGAALCEDLNTRGSAQQTFLANQLKTTLVNNNIAQSGIAGTTPLASMGGSVITNANNFANISALATNSNDQLSATDSGVATGQYTGSGSADAGVVADNKTVTLGFAFESAAGADSNASELVRQNLMQDVVNYLLGTADVNDWTLY